MVVGMLTAMRFVPDLVECTEAANSAGGGCGATMCEASSSCAANFRNSRSLAISAASAMRSTPKRLFRQRVLSSQ